MSHSSILFEKAKDSLVGGVNSPVRAFKAVGGNPIFFKSGKGPYLLSEEGETYIDYVLSWGPLILGHAHPYVVSEIEDAVKCGTSFGAPTEKETKLANLIREFIPSMQKCRFVNSGTEATMSAIRLARGFTKRDIIVKFNGCYHGHVDSLLVAAGSGGLTLGTPDSAGVPESFAAHTRVLEFNDEEGVRDLFKQEGEKIAAIIVEPVCGNMGLVLPKPGYLQILRDLCTESGALLIFDEVMTGFRVHLSGAQAHFGVEPDLTCLGKVMGGGLPCAAYGGRHELMAHLSPLGPVYQAGTLSGNPIAMTAGLATLTQLKTTDAFEIATQNTLDLVTALKDLAKKYNISCQIQHLGTMFAIFYTKQSIYNLEDVKSADLNYFSNVYQQLLKEGVYMAPSQFESNFMSAVHSKEDINRTVQAFESVWSSGSKTE